MSKLSITRFREALLYVTLVMLMAWALTPRYADAAGVVTAQADLAWTLPTTDTLGDPLTGENALQKMQVFVGTAPIPDSGATPTIELPPASTTFEYTSEVQNGSTLYFRIAACNALCSELTGHVTKEIRVSVPNVPTGVTVTLRVNLSQTATP